MKEGHIHTQKSWDQVGCACSGGGHLLLPKDHGRQGVYYVQH